jgi:hypothetical protein
MLLRGRGSTRWQNTTKAARRTAYERLRERGVRFLGEPYRYPWGIGALLLDQDGSPILIQQESGEE